MTEVRPCVIHVYACHKTRRKIRWQWIYSMFSIYVELSNKLPGRKKILWIFSLLFIKWNVWNTPHYRNKTIYATLFTQTLKSNFLWNLKIHTHEMDWNQKKSILLNQISKISPCFSTENLYRVKFWLQSEVFAVDFNGAKVSTLSLGKVRKKLNQQARLKI